MKIESIKFTQGIDEGGDGCAVPSEVTLTMSIMEAAQIACIFGEMADSSFTKRGWPITHIYADLTGDLFNRYWDDGVAGAFRQ